jgi:hypothetical protein
MAGEGREERQRKGRKGGKDYEVTYPAEAVDFVGPLFPLSSSLFHLPPSLFPFCKHRKLEGYKDQGGVVYKKNNYKCLIGLKK